MFGRLVRSAFAIAAQQSHQYEQLAVGRPFALSLCSGAAASGTGYGSRLEIIASRSYSAASEEGDDTCRANSHASASTSHHSLGDGLSTSRVKSALLSSSFKLQQLRSYGYLPPKRRFQLPEHIASLVHKKLRENKREIVHPPPPTLEKRVMTEASKRVGCIATKAGMTQEWDEHGVRVPLTVLWIDECQVVGLKTQQVHGYTALIVGAGHRRQKCMPPSVAGFFLKAGVPFKKRLTEWQVSEDAMVPVGTHISAAHYVAGQRVDVTGWTKYKGFQGVMKRWGFKGLPASHGVSLTHRSPGAIGNRNDPGKIWKGKKLPGHMGNERRTVHHCLVYKVDAARNLVYIRGQVPGLVGHAILLRDSLLTKPTVRASWGLPFPTHIAAPEQLAALPAPGDVTALPDPAAVSVYANPKDPYRMYREETDYFPIEWKKGE